MEVGAGGIVMGRQGTFRVAAWDSEKFSHRPPIEAKRLT